VRLGAPVALFEVLRRKRTVVDAVGARVVAPAQLERVDVEFRGELVEQAFERKGPLDEAGYCTVRTLSQAYSIFIGPSVVADQPERPMALMKSPPSATSVPSDLAAAVRRWMVALRFPAAMFSSRRVSAHLTGRPVRFAISAPIGV
jgi:hypothetical protein